MQNQTTQNGYTNPRIDDSIPCNAYRGGVKWAPTQSIWFSFMALTAIIGGVLTFSASAFMVFLISTATSLCLGHSLGMHRLLIHRSYRSPKWLEYVLVHFGVLVGLAGPLGMMRTHDMRDWAQRQSKCHDFYSHQQPMLIDHLWQIHCQIKLDSPPQFHPEPLVAHDKVYQWMERTWMWQQLPWAILFFLLGGIDWVIWGICMRVTVSILGHWLIGYFAHNEGERHWHIEGASAQGYNVKCAALITMGESWHNNHHAYPGSARLGLAPNQTDPGWWVLKGLEKIGLVSDLKLPENLLDRPELVPFNQ